jgi:hypothetical protein
VSCLIAHEYKYPGRYFLLSYEQLTNVSFVNVLTSNEIVLAFVMFGLFAIGFPIIEYCLRKKFNVPAMRSTIWIDRAASCARAMIVGGFVYFCYPTMFGLSVAPSLEYLSSNGAAEFGSDLAFVAVFALSILATSGVRWKFILPFQACLATTYLFFELTRYLGVTTASAWPGVNVMLAIVLVAYVANRVASRISGSRNGWVVAKFDLTGHHVTIGQILSLLAQAPIVLLFAYGLGQQIAI